MIISPGDATNMNFLKRLSLSLLVMLPVSLSRAQAAPVKLNLFFYKQEIREALKEMAVAFSKKNPDIQIETEMVPNDSLTVLKSRLASGAAPDIMQLQAYSNVAEFAAAGYLLDLSGEAVVKKVIPNAMDSVNFKGKVYALPMDFGAIGILYNKDLFKKHGLAAPATYRELQIVANKLNAAGITPFAGLLKANWSSGHFFAMLHSTMTGSSEKTLTWVQKMDSGQSSWGEGIDTRKFFSIADFYKGNMAKGAVEWDWNEQQAAFATGKAAMMVQGLWSYLPAIKTNPQLNVGFVPFPASNKADEVKFFADVDSTFAISATASKPKTEAAKKFFNWLATKEGIKMWTEKCQLAPTFKDASVKEMPEPFRDLMSHVNKHGSYPWEFAMYPVAVWEDATKNGAQGYFFGKTTPEQFIKSFDFAWQKAAAAKGKK
jgi:raffinose/stachyose/melibiose transport system substrate-binding protein